MEAFQRRIRWNFISSARLWRVKSRTITLILRAAIRVIAERLLRGSSARNGESREALRPLVLEAVSDLQTFLTTSSVPPDVVEDSIRDYQISLESSTPSGGTDDVFQNVCQSLTAFR